MNTPEPLETRLAALITHLSPSAPGKIALSTARKLRARQQRNIKRRQAPDGAPFKPRKAQPLRGKRGRIGREIFTGLRTAKLMKAKGSGDAVVEFTGWPACIITGCGSGHPLIVKNQSMRSANY